MRASLLRGLIATAAAFAAAGCGAFKEPQLKPHVWVESAHDCTHGPNCKPVPKPAEISLKVEHEHDLKIIREEPAQIATSLYPGDIVHYEQAGDVGPNEARVVIKADAIGATTLNVELKNRAHPNDQSSMKIKTFSKRVTVVAWVDGSAIDPDAIAPHASDTVKEFFRDDKLCGYAVMKIALHGLGWKDLPFISSESPEQDRLYAQAFLVKSSANRAPTTLAEVFQRRDYRLLNDFQVIGEEGRRFATDLLHHEVYVGETPLPCGGDVLRQDRRMREFIDKYRPDQTERHKRNGERLEPAAPERIGQLNQGRLGRVGRLIQHALTETDREPDEITPWVWSLIAFDEKGRFVQENAKFPTYYVYIDGQFQCGTKQASFEDFLKRDASWQFDSAGVDLATLNFEREGVCP